MNTIKVIFERDRVLLNEKNEIILYDNLPEEVRRLFSDGMNGHNMSYYQEIHDSFKNNEKYYQEDRFIRACYIKEKLPTTKVLFQNKNKYYEFEVDCDGFSEIPENFDISTMVLLKGDKELKVMFDWEATGIWDYEGSCIPVEWVPVSQKTRNLITEFQKGLNSMCINYDGEYTEAEDRESASYMLIGLKAAIELKKELPDWKINFYNYGKYYDLPVDPENNCSEITIDMIADNIKNNELEKLNNEKQKKISINIWDDYYNDGYVPEGESQDTYAYVESKSTDEDSKKILILLKETIEKLSESNREFTLELKYYDSAKVYPNLVGTDNEWCLYKRWQLEIKNITHEIRESLIKKLKNEPLIYKSKEIEVYSES